MDFSLNRNFVLIFLIHNNNKHIAYYGVSKVARKRTKLNHNDPNCFTNDT